MKAAYATVQAALKDAAPFTFGLIIVLGFFFVLFQLLTGEFPPENKDLITSLGKTLENILIMAVGFFFGSTSSSKAKDETISAIAQLPVAPIAPIAPIAPVAPVLPVTPIEVQHAEKVSVQTDKGNVNITPKPKPRR